LIERDLAEGRYPDNDDLAAALLRPEPVPESVRLYLARLLRGKLDRRGRPKASEEKTAYEAQYLRRRVERWERVFRIRARAPDPLTRAYERVAREEGWKNAGVAKRRYFEAKAMLENKPIFITDTNLARLLGRK
jgi:hypothetical protein